MRILLLAPQPFYQNRGTPIAVRMLAEELQSAGHNVDLLVFHEGENVELKGVNLHRISSFPGLSNIPPGFSFKKILCDLLMAVKALGLCRKAKYDFIHGVEEAVFIALLLKKIYGIPYVYDIDSWLSDQLIDKYSFLGRFRYFFNFFERRAVSDCDGAVAVCKALQEKVVEIDEEKRVVILEDVSLLDQDSTETESLRELVQNDQEILLYVGNLEKYQGIDFLFQAFQKLQSTGKKTNLVVIGGSSEHRKKYEQYAEDLAIGSRVFLIGPRSIEKLGMYLRQADLLVSPRTEGVNTPMKIYSYMDSGVPIVATRIESHTQVLDEQCSYLADPDAVQMAEVFRQALREKEAGQKRAEYAKEIVKNNYSREAFRKKLTEFYIELSNVRNLRI